MGRDLAVLGDGLDGGKSLLADQGILLVVELLLESFDRPVGGGSHVSSTFSKFLVRA